MPLDALTIREKIKSVKQKVYKTLWEENLRKSLFRLSPQISYKNPIKVFELKKINMDSYEDEELIEKHFQLIDTLKKFPPAPFKVITTNRRGYLKFPRTKDPQKNAFLEAEEKWINENWNIRERRSFLIYEPQRLGNSEYGLIGELTGEKGWAEERPVSDFFKELAYFFGGSEYEPFGIPLKEWKYGFQIGNKYCLVMAQFGVNFQLVRFANDLLNAIELDSIHLLHFEPVDRFVATRKVVSAINYAKQTNLPQEVVMQLSRLKDQVELGQATLSQFLQALFLFHEDPEYLERRAWDIKKLLGQAYPMTFEGNFEFPMVFALTDFDFTKKRELEGYINISTVDYVASLLPVWGRYKGKPEGMFIPMLNEALEPAYIPIDRSLFNISIQGQMGSGKSVENQYIASLFDMNIFIEKIQGDEGSYGVFVKYFGGNYIPIAENIPISLNPFGKVYEYYTIDVYQLLRDIAQMYPDKDFARPLTTPEKEFSDAERGAMEDILNEFLLKEKRKEVDKNELINLASKDSRTIRFKALFEKLPDDFKWNIKVVKNPSKKIFLNTILLFMVKGTENYLDPDTIGEIEKLLDSFYDQKYREWFNGKLDKEHEILLSEFYQYLEDQEKNPVVEKLLKRLYSYKQGGKYGHIFDTPSKLDLNQNNYFFEVRINDPELLSVVMLSILEFVNKHFGSYKVKEKTKLVIIDEGWFFLADPLAKGFIEEAFRTYRKRGISIGLASQKPEDFKAMVNYLPYVCILYLEKHDEAIKTYDLSPKHEKLLKLIDKPKAYGYKFSKSFWKFKNEYGKNEYGLFITPSYPEFRWIVETDPQFKLKREELTRKCGSLQKAIKSLAFNNGKC
jgi:hypothetical protein